MNWPQAAPAGLPQHSPCQRTDALSSGINHFHRDVRVFGHGKSNVTLLPLSVTWGMPLKSAAAKAAETSSPKTGTGKAFS